MPDDDWKPITEAPRGPVLRLKGPTYETNGLFDPHHKAWCGTDAPHFCLPFGPAFQPTHWKQS